MYSRSLLERSVPNISVSRWVDAGSLFTAPLEFLGQNEQNWDCETS